MTTSSPLSPTIVRRMAITGQCLAGPPPAANPAGMFEVIRRLNCLQLDPISAVAPSHLLVLWSRLGVYDPVHLDTLLWEERCLFEYWAHAASIVLTEDYQIHRRLMDQFPNRARTRDWLAANLDFQDYVLGRLREAGPLLSKALEDRAAVPWASNGWTTNRNVGMMLDFLWTKGQVMVAGRQGRTRLWDLAERCLPDWTPTERLSEREIVRRAAQKALLSLGVARPRDIKNHFIRNGYPDLEAVLTELAAEGKIVQVQVAENGQDWPGPWYLHHHHLPTLQALIAGDWQPRTTLLSPFDNLICDRQRTEDLFNFHFRLEIYTPKAKRKYGYYVLPILHGDRLIGRLDPKFDRKTGLLTIKALYAEPDAPTDAETQAAIGRAIASLARFVGASAIRYGPIVPPGWPSEVTDVIELDDKCHLA